LRREKAPRARILAWAFDWLHLSDGQKRTSTSQSPAINLSKMAHDEYRLDEVIV
jgi:hypothetical protein